MTDSWLPGARRVLVGVDATGASTVVDDDVAPATILPNGIRLDEVWQQRALPAGPLDAPAQQWVLGPAAPEQGVVVRLLSVPAGLGRDAPPKLHSDPSLHVITMLDGVLDITLETGAVTLHPGETIVLRDSLHDLVNRGVAPARFVYTSMPLRGGPSGSGPAHTS